jgi:hypothetical protein
MKDKKNPKKAADQPASPATAPDQTGKRAKSGKAKAEIPTVKSEAGAGAGASASAKAKAEKPTGKADAGVKSKAEKPKDVKKALNFKVSADFRREFKTYASSHDMKLGKLLEAAFESYRKQHGG